REHGVAAAVGVDEDAGAVGVDGASVGRGDVELPAGAAGKLAGFAEVRGALAFAFARAFAFAGALAFALSRRGSDPVGARGDTREHDDDGEAHVASVRDGARV